MSNHVDVAIVGAGAAGSVLAYRLATAGLSVHVVERGARLDPATVEHNERAMMPRVYKHGGPQTSSDHAISILQGAGIGGSTVINNAIWLRADLDRLLPEWAAIGAHVDRAALTRAYTDLERLLHVASVPRGLMTHATDVFTSGCKTLGVDFQYLDNNRDQCTGCGWCNYACKYSRKTSALVTFVPWAEALGARFEDQCTRVHLDRVGARVHGITYERAGNTHHIDADQVVVSSGAIGSSTVLLASGITAGGQVGQRLHVLGGVLVTAFTRQDLQSYDGIGLTCMARPGPRYVLESFYATPGASAVTMPGWGRAYAERMSRYSSAAQAGAMVPTGPRGRVRLRRDGTTRIDLKLSKEEVEAVAEGQKQLARIYLAGGADSVALGLLHESPVRDEQDLAAMQGALRDRTNLIYGSAHPQGGNTMCDDPARGVVGSDFRVHGVDGLSVIDASVIPINLFANCQATVMALAWVGAESVLAGAT